MKGLHESCKPFSDRLDISSQLNHAQGFANPGYWIRRSAMGRGMAASAALLAARFGFER
jgi:hypothetical protein